jgi:hypothetical protein
LTYAQTSFKMARKLEEYCIVLEGADIEKVRKLHEIVGDFKERILTDKVLQNILYNRGYVMEEKRPENYCEIGHVAFNARIASLALTYVNYIMDLAIRPQLTKVESPRIIVPGERNEIKFSTPQGHNALDIERLQREWFENHEIVKVVREYQKNLEKSIDEFSMQTILSKIDHARAHFIPPGKEWKQEREIQERVLGSLDPASVSVLDNAYYGMAMRFYGALGKLWRTLIENDFGRKFVMTREELLKGIM